MNKPSSTIQAAGIGGLVAGVPIGSYIGGICGGLLSYKNPELYGALASATDVEAAIGGFVTVVIATVIGYFKKENVLNVTR